MDSELTLRSIFEAGLAGYLKTHVLPLFLYKAAEAIRLCRTANRRLNPHVQALVTGGGLAPDGTWFRGRRRDHLLSLDVVRLIFRAKFQDGMRRLIRRGKLRLPPDINQNDALWQHEKALRRKWIVERRKRYPHGQGVATYLAR